VNCSACGSENPDDATFCGAYLTAATAALAGGYFALEDLGEFRVKGVAEPVAVHRLIGLGAARTRFDISRARLLERMVQALKEGGFLRTVDGEAGLVPAKDLGTVTISDLITHLRTGIGTSPPLADDDAVRFIDDVFGSLAREQHRITGDLDFRTLAQKFAAARRPESEDPVELAVAAEATARIDERP
jgi:hypothetical protein